jgi:hypothetical protein
MTLFLFWSGGALGIDRLILEVGEASIAGTQLSGTTVELDLSTDAPSLAVKAQRLRISDPHVGFREIHVTCKDPVIKEPEFSCDHGRVAALGGPTGAINIQASTRYDTAKKLLSFSGSGLSLAGGQVRASGQLTRSGWTLTGRADALRVADLRKLAAP